MENLLSSRGFSYEISFNSVTALGIRQLMYLQMGKLSMGEVNELGQG